MTYAEMIKALNEMVAETRASNERIKKAIAKVDEMIEDITKAIERTDKLLAKIE